MILTDARRVKHDMGTGNARGHLSADFIHVLPQLEQDGYRQSPPVTDCPICGGTMPLGRYVCSLKCSRARFDRMGVG